MGYPQESLTALMIGLAVATPVLAAAIWLRGRSGTLKTPPNKLIILFLAGPINLLLWIYARGEIRKQGVSEIAAVLIVVGAFIAVRFGFARRRDRSTPKEDDSEEPGGE
jgi:hypothetical protein